MSFDSKQWSESLVSMWQKDQALCNLIYKDWVTGERVQPPTWRQRMRWRVAWYLRNLQACGVNFIRAIGGKEPERDNE